MEIFELESYILESCKFLGIHLKPEQPHTYFVQIPSKLENEFSGMKDFFITFEKSPDPKLTYITFESFFTQKIAKLVAEKNDGISSGIIHFKIDQSMTKLKALFTQCQISVEKRSTEQVDYILIWFKTTIKGIMIDEYLKGLKFDIKSKKIEELAGDVNEIMAGISEELIGGYDELQLDQYFEEIMQHAKKGAEQYLERKQLETLDTLNLEVKRINDYYDMLEADNQLAETSKGKDPQAEIELLKKERAALIEQQKSKYKLNFDETVIEPVAILMLRESTETAVSKVVSPHGEVNIRLSGKEALSIRCEVTNEGNGPFTITSDNKIAKTDKVFNCIPCSRLLDIHQKKACHVCNEAVCNDCKITSAVSGKVLCSKHVIECPSCLHSAGSNEQHLCSNCELFYCNKCNPTNICVACSSLKPVSGITPQIQIILNNMVIKSSAKKYDYAEKGNRIMLLGKGMLFKDFFVVFDKKENKIVHSQQFGLFNKKKQ